MEPAYDESKAYMHLPIHVLAFTFVWQSLE